VNQICEGCAYRRASTVSGDEFLVVVGDLTRDMRRKKVHRDARVAKLPIPLTADGGIRV
jgi:hypothetical protein